MAEHAPRDEAGHGGRIRGGPGWCGDLAQRLGVSWFADVDGSARRIVCLHDSETHFGSWLSAVDGWVDGVACVSPAAAAAVTRLLPDLPPERLAVLPLPIEPPSLPEVQRPPGGEWIIGCAGRSVRVPKRWDRLIPFVKELRHRGVNFRLEILSDGPMRGWLEQRLGRDPATQFLGWQATADYWRRLQGWDAAVFFSDHEGGPIVLLEVMAAGVIPIYPAIGGSLGDALVPALDRRCHYAAGDAAAAARALQQVLSSPPAQLDAMRRRAQDMVRPHTGGGYEAVFADFVRRISVLPRRSRRPDGQRLAHFADRLPLGFITRFLPSALWR